MPWWASALLGGGLFGALGALGAWLWTRKLAADVTVARCERDEARREGKGLMAALEAERAARKADSERAAEELADLHARKVDEQARAVAVVRGKNLEIARLRKVLADHATIPSIRARLDDLDGIGVLPQVPAPDAATGDRVAVPVAAPASLAIIEELK